MKIYVYTFRVMYADTDQMGVMWHGNHYRYMEQARTELLRDIDLPYKEMENKHKIMLPATETFCKYRKAIFYDQIVNVETFVSGLHKASVEISYRFKDADDSSLLADGYTLHAFVSTENNKIIKIPPDIKKAISQIMD